MVSTLISQKLFNTTYNTIYNASYNQNILQTNTTIVKYCKETGL